MQEGDDTNLGVVVEGIAFEGRLGVIANLPKHIRTGLEAELANLEEGIYAPKAESLIDKAIKQARIEEECIIRLLNIVKNKC